MRKVKTNPAKVILWSYIGFIGVGFLLFVLLPTTEKEVGYLDLLFTVTSAVTVTGPVVLDPATDITLQPSFSW